ncbi:hypothetical protein [Streptomyces sp. LS1784]|uniref:hypothetical protein n=1 Tax=Streptomyces sp. LS1784 TaxID=2851533 RepID=UPI001CD01479|nr:hypothetical protein [Streptomyces sp. LS1784]
MTREQRIRILGPAGMALVERDSATDLPPSPEQIARLRAIFAGTGRKASHASATIRAAA